MPHRPQPITTIARTSSSVQSSPPYAGFFLLSEIFANWLGQSRYYTLHPKAGVDRHAVPGTHEAGRGCASDNSRRRPDCARTVHPATLARCEELAAHKKILAVGPVSGTLAIVLIVEVRTVPEFDHLLTSLAAPPPMETKVTPLTTFDGRGHKRRDLKRGRG